MNGADPVVFIIGDPESPWAAATVTALAPLHVRGVAEQPAELEPHASDVDVCLVQCRSDDAMVTVAEVLRRAPRASIVLLGEHVDPETRSAAYQAGVAFVTGASPTAEELRSVVRMAHDQNRAGSPELVRAMCRTMVRLSSLAAQASNNAFIDAAVQEIADLFGADVVSVQLAGDDGDLQIVAHKGLGDRALRNPSRGGISDAVLRSGEPRITLRGFATGESSVLPRADLCASMCVPIASPSVGERGRGVINIARKNGRSIFTARDLDVATSIARLMLEVFGGIEARAAAAETERQLQAAERLMMLGEIAAGIAHEVANPLAVARANVGSLIAYLTEASPLLAELEAAHPQLSEMLDDLPAVVCETWEGLSRADEAIRQVKSLARAEQGGGRDQALAISELVQTTVRFLGARLPRVRTNLDAAALVRGSAVELSQILVNLLVNAADACDERTGRAEQGYQPTIVISVTRSGERVQLCIEDNGIGMSEETKTRAFMPLFTTKKGTRGTGLGLSLVRRLIDRHGGNVRVASTPGTGTTFTVLLPLASPDPAPASPDGTQDQPGDEGRSGSAAARLLARIAN